MRNWWKFLAAGLVSLGGMASSASAQFPPPSPGGMGTGMPGMMPGMPGMGPIMPTSMGAPPQGAFNGNPALAGMPAEFPNPGMPSQEPASPFSIKDDGMPNAFTSLHDPRPTDPARFQIWAGYSFLFFRGQQLPVMATTGSLQDPFPGALGQPNTVIVDNGGRDPGVSSALRVGFTYWVLDPECFCIDANYFVMEQRSVIRGYASNAAGSPLLIRPFYNVVAGTEDGDPRSIPFAATGTLSDSARTRLMGAEVNFKWVSANMCEGASFSFFGGIRWLRLEEQYMSYDTTTNLAPGGPNTTFSDTFQTSNQFYGGQVGMEWMYRWGRANFGFISKIAVGPIYQNLRIAGQTNQTDLTTNTTVTDNQQALFAQPSNVGSYTHMQCTVLPEVGFKLNVDLSDRIRFNVGYTYFWMYNTARPGDNIDRRVNIQPLLSGGGNGPGFPAPPASIRTNIFDVQMLNLGLEFVF